MKQFWVMLVSLMLVAGVANAVTNDEDLAFAHRLQNVFVRVAQEASRSVVVINSTQQPGKGQAGDSEDDDGDGDEGQPQVPKQFQGTPFEYFFRHHPQMPPPDQEINSEGSGIVYRKDGYILTNSHVIRGADTITVHLKDKREFPAKVVGLDPLTDIAVIKIEVHDLPAAQLGNSDAVRVGQWAIAIGAPYQLEYSFTVGVISAKGRDAVWNTSGSAYEDYLQTDASINPGNSGGPLCDIDGQVIGINTLIRGINRGIGFAIPINMASDIADQLITKGKIVRPWLGIQIEALADNPELMASAKDLKQGVVVRAIYPDTPAASSDLRPADIIVAVDGVEVGTPRELQQQVLRKKIGDKIALKIVRDGKPTTVSLQTGELPDDLKLAAQPTPSGKDQAEAFGLTVQTLTPQLAERLGVERTTGVVVTEVEADSAADSQGMQHGDIITEVNRVPVHSVDEFKKAMANGDKDKGVLLYVKRNGTFTFVVLKDSE